MRISGREIHPAAIGVVAIATLCAVVACSGTTVVLNGTPARATFSGFATASNVVCVQPAATSQAVTLPSTGSVSATISFGAFPAGASGCDEVKIATGADAETAAWSARSVLAARLAGDESNPPPLLTISVGEGIDGNPIFGYETIVSGAQLNTGSNLNFPDGTYYATMTNPNGATSQLYIIPFTAKNGVLTVSTIPLPNGKQFPVIIVANTSSILTLYPRGYVPVVPVEPTPSPSPTPPATATPSPGPSGSPSPSPTPLTFQTASPQPGWVGNPPPAPNSIIGSYSFTDPSTTSCQPGQMLCNGMNLPIEQVDGSDAAMSIPTNFYGTISFSAQIGYMGLYLGNPLSNCPSDWEVGANTGGSGTISIPQNDPAGGAACEINFQTNPPGSTNVRGYYEGIALQYVDGVPCGVTCTSTASRRRRRW
jgi:hypothetical protein